MVAWMVVLRALLWVVKKAEWKDRELVQLKVVYWAEPMVVGMEWCLVRH